MAADSTDENAPRSSSGSGTNIVLFWIMRDWGQYGRAYEKIAEQLARQPNVGRLVCVLPPMPGERGQWNWPLKFFHLDRRLMVVSQRTAVAPADGAGYRARRWLNARGPDLALRGMLLLLGFRPSNTLLWIYPPHRYIARLTELVPAARTVVQIVDNNALLQATSADHRLANADQYDALARAADCVVVSSAANFDAFSRLNARCLLSENAVDPSFIHSPSALPSRAGPRPRLGYVGWITERTDIELLEQLARERPQYDLVLAGPDRIGGLERLLGLPNVQWLGTVPYAEVPRLIASFDVCLIPHRDTPYSRSMSPLKLFQYLGSGRPIVSTEVAGIERWRELISVAQAPADFVAAVDAALSSDSMDEARARIAAASKETWDLRVGAMYRSVLESLRAA